MPLRLFTVELDPSLPESRIQIVQQTSKKSTTSLIFNTDAKLVGELRRFIDPEFNTPENLGSMAILLNALSYNINVLSGNHNAQIFIPKSVD